ncbi:MAG: hypothetical protein IT273_14370 [Chitinophagales bacterium]|nr:hypothetical protein [Chitinophagales bacterium]
MGVLTIEEIKAQYPDQWVLVGNPIIKDTKLLNGIVLFHSKDKKEVCYLGKNLTEGYDKITLTFTGTVKNIRRIGVMKRV